MSPEPRPAIIRLAIQPNTNPITTRSTIPDDCNRSPVSSSGRHGVTGPAATSRELAFGSAKAPPVPVRTLTRRSRRRRLGKSDRLDYTEDIPFPFTAFERVEADSFELAATPRGAAMHDTATAATPISAATRSSMRRRSVTIGTSTAGATSTSSRSTGGPTGEVATLMRSSASCAPAARTESARSSNVGAPSDRRGATAAARARHRRCHGTLSIPAVADTMHLLRG